MASFKTFLIEIGESTKNSMGDTDAQKSADKAYTPKRVSIDRFIEWCEKNAPKYLKNKGSDGIIYRGVSRTFPPLGIIDTDDFDRVSANTRNYYTLWIDNHEQWKKFPKRSKSLICTTSEDAAVGYGNLCVVIPSDDSHLGLCPMDDIWYSIETRGLQLNEIVEEIYHLITSNEGEEVAEACQKDYSKLISSLKKITLENINKMRSFAFIRDFLWLMKAHEYENMYEVMEYIMDPLRSDFKQMKSGSYSMHRNTNREIWIQGECAVIFIEELEELSLQLREFKKLKAFLNNHGIPHEYE